MGHGFAQTPVHHEPDQRMMIGRTVEAIGRLHQRGAARLARPGADRDVYTPDLLAEAGLRYVADWVADDRPCRLTTTHGPLLTMPYAVELNDIPIMMIQHHRAEEFFERSLAQFDRLVAEALSPGSLGGAKVMSFAVHPYITGSPHRIGTLERLLDALSGRPKNLFWQGRQIHDWYLESDDPT